MDDQTAEPPRPSAEPASKAAPPPEDKPAHPTRNRLLIGLAVLAGLAVIIGGVLWWLDARHYVSTDDAFISADITQMSPRIAGRVVALQVTDNQHVSAGDVLVRLDPRDQQAKLDQAKAQQANAAAGLSQAQADIAVRQADLDQAQANLRAADAQLQQAKQDYDRYKAINPHAITQQQLDNAAATFQSAQAKRDAAAQAVGGAQARIRAAQAQVLAAQASEQQAAANVAAADLQLSYGTITAPVSGTIAHRNVNVGDTVSAGQPLFAIVQDGRWVTANLKETQLPPIRIGQPVDIAIDAVPSVTFHGKVDSFQPGTGSAFSVLPAENATGNYVKVVQRVPVKIVFDDDRVGKYQLSPGMSVVPSIKVR